MRCTGGRGLVTVALVLLVTACASGPAARQPLATVGPTPADAQLVVTLRQPLIAELIAGFDPAGALPQQLRRDAARLSGDTELLVLGLLPAARGAVLALVPRERYPAELIGWQLHLSDLHFHSGADSGVRHFWSDPAIGFGIVVFPNLIFSFWLDPREFGAAGDLDDTPARGVREMIRTAIDGSGVPLHPAAAELSGAALFAYLPNVTGFLAELDPRVAAAAARLPTGAAWAAGQVADTGLQDAVVLAGGIAVQAANPAPYLALTRLLLVTLLAQLDLLGGESLREVQVTPGTAGTIAMTGLRIPRSALIELLKTALGGDDGGL